MKAGLPLAEPQRHVASLLAVVALVVMQLFRAEQQWHTALVVTESVLVLSLALWLARGPRLRSPRVWWATRSIGTGSHLSVGPRTVWMVAFSLLPIGVQWLSRRYGMGDPGETVALMCVQNAALVASLSPVPGHRRIACLLSSFLVLFVLFATVNGTVYLVAGLFGFLGLWALMGSYWDRLSVRMAVHSRRQIPVRPAFLSAALVAVVLVLVVGLIWGRDDAGRTLAGFMPTSGGDQYGGAYGRSGVGEGEQLIAATDNATTVGAIESDLFLASEQPSLYDAYLDMYGEPSRPQQQREQAVAIDGNQGQEGEEKAGESQETGREFSTVRQSPHVIPLQEEDRNSPALLLVEGEVPLHLRLETYDQFDGRVWSHAPTDRQPPGIRLTPVGDRPWMQVDRYDPRRIFRGKRTHVIRVINLDSPRIAAPARLAAWMIDRIDRPNFYGWTADDVLEMPDRKAVPRLTTVHVISQFPTRQGMLEQGDFSDRGPTSPARDPLVTRHTALAQDWAAARPRGWRQVSAIVERLRGRYVLDSRVVVSPTTDDVVRTFLEQGRGPDYLFATTAAVLLRSLGYPTRLVSGFYARPERFVAKTRHTRVIEEDVHMWVEVCIDGYNWVPLEPSPGYEPPPLQLTWQERIAEFGRWFGEWCWRQRGGLLAGMLLLVVACWQRRGLFDLTAWSVWWIGSCIGCRQPSDVKRVALTERRRVWLTLRLVEWRAWMAGQARPSGSTLRSWYLPALTCLPPTSAHALQRLLQWGDWSLYAGASQLTTEDLRLLQATCRDAAKHCTTQHLYQIKRS